MLQQFPLITGAFQTPFSTLSIIQLISPQKHITLVRVHGWNIESINQSVGLAILWIHQRQLLQKKKRVNRSRGQPALIRRPIRRQSITWSIK